MSDLTAAPTAADISDPEVIAKVLRISGGNLRLVVRLLTQIDRILTINQLSAITADVVDAARDVLVIGIA